MVSSGIFPGGTTVMNWDRDDLVKKTKSDDPSYVPNPHKGQASCRKRNQLFKPAWTISLIFLISSFPVGVLGRESQNSTCRGILYSAK